MMSDETATADDDEPGSPAVLGGRMGRYELRSILGAGGMGIVFEAVDPELDRAVAVKIRRSPAGGLDGNASARLRREGVTMARLTHPNVIRVYDVGVDQGHVFVAMELVRGQTLAQWVATGTRSPEEIVAAFVQAGRGLAAAHEAGLVHRDFKPQNVLISDDGRVLVTDFGLARSIGAAEPAVSRAAEGSPTDVVTRRGQIVGTPAYMAPEQWTGEPVDARADQYSFCISLWGALVGPAQSPVEETASAKASVSDGSGDAPAWPGPIDPIGADRVPARIRAPLLRGLDAAPEKRFGSMAELLACLEPPRPRVWPARTIAAGGAIAIAALVTWIVLDRGVPAAAIDPCSGGSELLVGAWSSAVRDGVVAHLGTFAQLGADEARHVGGRLDAYSDRWLTAHHQACLAHARQELTPALYEQRLVCLTQARDQLGAVGELLGTIDGEGLASALVAAGSLPDVAACAEETGGVAPPPAAVAERVAEVRAHLERALVLTVAQRPDAVTVAHAVTVEARATGYTPLIARALMVEGRAMVDVYEPSAEILEESWRLALASSDDVLAVEAYARWTFGRAVLNDTDIDGWPLMEQLAGRLGGRGRFARALLYNNRAIVHLVLNDNARARELLERARREARDAPEIELLAIESNLTNLEPDRDRRIEAQRRVLAREEAALGPHHPKALSTRYALALEIEDPAAARAPRETICTEWETWNPTEASHCAFDVAWLVDGLGDERAAVAWMTKVVARSTDAEQRRLAAAYVATFTDRPDAAKLVAEVVREQTATPPTTFPQHAGIGDAFALAARAAEHRGDRAAATRLWAKSLVQFEATGMPFYRGRVDQARRGAAAMARASCTASTGTPACVP